MLLLLSLPQVLPAAAMQGPSNAAGQSNAAPQQQPQQQAALGSSSCSANDYSILYAPQLNDFIAKQLTVRKQGEQTPPAGFVQGLSALLVTHAQQGQQACSSSSSSLLVPTPVASSSSSSGSLWYSDAPDALKSNQLLNAFVHEVMQGCEQLLTALVSKEDTKARCKQPVLHVLKAAATAVQQLKQQQQQRQLSDSLLQAVIALAKLAVGYCIIHVLADVFQAEVLDKLPAVGAQRISKTGVVANIVNSVQPVFFSSSPTWGHRYEATPAVPNSAGSSGKGSSSAIAAAAVAATRSEVDASAGPAAGGASVWTLSQAKLSGAMKACPSKFWSYSGDMHNPVSGCRFCVDVFISSVALLLLLSL
jgi:hypothetical protein